MISTEQAATKPVRSPEPGLAAFPSTPHRELQPVVAEKVMVIGLDGATFDVLDPLMAAGKMPHLAELVRTGTAGILDSTKPPITPAAWTTFMTGKGPGRHGIVDFERYDAKTNKLTFNSTLEIRVKTIWDMLSEKGFRVGSVNLPMTYPPRRVNGFMISGFETPSIESDFTWPPELKTEILKRWPDYSYRSSWKRKAIGGDEVFEQNIRFIERSFGQGAEIATFCGQKYGWDVLMVLYKLVDNLQHKTWKYLDPVLSQVNWNPKRAALVTGCFEKLDVALGELFRYARQNRATILIMSDHGHGSLDGKAQPNALLSQWGYLKIKSPITQASVRARQVMDRLLGRTSKRFEANLGIEHELALDWSQTRACVIHAGIYGFLYISLKGRQPGGLVDPADYEPLRDELRRRFLAVSARRPSGETIPVYTEVHKTEELYQCSRKEQPWLPDLLLVPQPGLAVVRKIRSSAPVRWSSLRHLEGTHRIEGIFIANGPNVRQGHRIRAQIADIAPTLLASLGLRVPQDMEGKPLAELFTTPPTIEFETPRATTVGDFEEIYSEAEKAALTKRLTELGYLE